MLKYLSIGFGTAVVLGSLHFGLNQVYAQELRFEAEDTVRGVVRAPQRVDISTDISVPILEVSLMEGQTFSKGDMLLDLDCSRLRAERNAARAAHSAASVELRQKRHLLKYGAAGKGEVDLASAQAAQSNAEVQAIEASMVDCRIHAPFDGRVAEVFVRAAQRSPVGEVMMSIIDNSNLEIELVVPSGWLRWVEPNIEFAFTVDETGRRYEAIVERTGAEVDAVSQTVKLYGRFSGDASMVLSGMSGNAVFQQPDGEPLTGALE